MWCIKRAQLCRAEATWEYALQAGQLGDAIQAMQFKQSKAQPMRILCAAAHTQEAGTLLVFPASNCLAHGVAFCRVSCIKCMAARHQQQHQQREGEHSHGAKFHN